MIGRTLSHYRVVERLGAGGMGEVYRAHDDKLDRDVALKVLPEGALADEAARSRFRKEAHALSRLSHPHVAHILDFDSQDGIDFLVMELVTGPSLEEVLRPGPLPEKDVVRLGTQLARGLQAAHDQGVVHRDLKPSNLALTPDGLLKILDFGLARLVNPRHASPGHTTATETAGAVVGSPPYMAPEQLLGRPPDARTDLYSAGAALYEMATSQRPFGSRSGVALTDAILHEPPPSPRSLQPSLSPGLEALILKSLDKDPELRHQTAREMLVDLERLQQRSAPPSSGSLPAKGAGTGPPSGATRDGGGHALRRRSTWRAFAFVATVAIAPLALGAWLLQLPPPLRITDIRPLRIDVGPEFAEWYAPTWTTDGVRLYYVAKKDGRFGLYQMAFSGGKPVEIPTPFGRGLELHGYLRSLSALLVVADPSGNPGGPAPVWLLPLPDGTPWRLGRLVANWAAVSPDEERIAVTINETDAPRIQLVRVDDPLAPPVREIRLPQGVKAARFAPDGKRLRYTAPGPAGHQGESWLWETSTTGDTPRPLWQGQEGTWTGDGRTFVFQRGLGLGAAESEAYRADVHAVREGRWPTWLRAVPVPLTSGPLSFSQVAPRPDGGGLLAFGTDRRTELQRFNRRTRRFEPFLAGESIEGVRPSPDGEWVAWVPFPEATLWRSRPDGSERLQLSRSRFVKGFSWSPDGTRIAFVSGGADDQGLGLRVVSAHGGQVETLKEAPGKSVPYWDPSWLPDGRSLVFSDISPRRPGIRKLDLATREVSPLPGAEQFLWPKCSPDGRILASRPSGAGVPVRPNMFVVYSPAKGTWEEIGPETLGYPTWTRDGRSFCGLTESTPYRIQCYSLDAGRMETLVEVSDAPLFGNWIDLDADDNPLVPFDRSTRDLYALDWEAP